MNSPSQNPQDIQKRAKTIRDIYRGYTLKLNALAKEQNRIIKEFLNSLKEKRIEAIRKTIDKS